MEEARNTFSDYAWNCSKTYSKPNVETTTATAYRRQLTLYLFPAFDSLAVEGITTDDVQRLFNGMTGVKATKNKARMVLNQILDFAAESELISQNPVKSRGSKSRAMSAKTTLPYSVEQMRYLVQHIRDIQESRRPGLSRPATSPFSPFGGSVRSGTYGHGHPGNGNPYSPDRSPHPQSA